METERPDTNTRCARCGRMFYCGISAGSDGCWCFSLSPAPVREGEGCRCPECLAPAAPNAPEVHE